MALKIVWTKRAQSGYDKVIDYLQTNITYREVQRFVRQSQEFFNLLSQYPEMLESTKRYKNVRRGPINKYTIVTYRIELKKGLIELINIRSARQRPLKS